jgi:uncharacterized membrane protein
MWCLVLPLVLLGVFAAAGRARYVADFAHRAEPLRTGTLRALDRRDPRALERPAEVARFDRRYGDHPVMALVHVVPGGLFLALAPFQFLPRLRRRYLTVHRWSGRVLILLAFVSASSALYFGLRMPFGGVSEAIAIAVFAGLFLFAIARAYLAIRRRQVARHREWMIRAFAVAIGISTVRVVDGLLDVALAPAGLRADHLFVISIWTGWMLTFGAAEVWIRRTRPGGVLAS